MDTTARQRTRRRDWAYFDAQQPLVMSMLHLREAFAHAALRDAQACHQAVDRSRVQYERSRGHEAEAPDWVQYFDETKLLADTGIAYARLGEPARAEPLITEGLRTESVMPFAGCA
ncbi:hypothetical protein [Streptomyces sp. NPDC054874]